MHATGDYFATCSYDKSWCFHNVETGKTLLNVTDKSVEKGFGCLCLHPDGLILGTGTQEKLVRMWDLKSQSNVATFEGHTQEVTSVSFSENGYHMASASADGTVRLWDLRKLKNIKILELGKEPVSTVAFDSSGQYLACGAGHELKLFSVKGWEPLHTLKDHAGPVTGVVFACRVCLRVVVVVCVLLFACCLCVVVCVLFVSCLRVVVCVCLRVVCVCCCCVCLCCCVCCCVCCGERVRRVCVCVCVLM